MNITRLPLISLEVDNTHSTDTMQPPTSSAGDDDPPGPPGANNTTCLSRLQNNKWLVVSIIALVGLGVLAAVAYVVQDKLLDTEGDAGTEKVSDRDPKGNETTCMRSTKMFGWGYMPQTIKVDRYEYIFV